MFGVPPPASPKDRLIFALDVPDLESAEPLIRRLAKVVGIFKIGSELFTGAGPMIVDLIHGLGGEVFLDLKFHDIPATVARAGRQAARLRAKMFTVHALGGRQMIRSAMSELSELTLIPGVHRPACLGVTLLTSHTESDLLEVGIHGPLADESVRLARLAVEAGADGVVASALELAVLRAALPKDVLFVTPGIRAAGEPAEDQARVVTAKEAIELGATYVVVGRPIRDANDPLAAAQRLVDEIASAKLP